MSTKVERKVRSRKRYPMTVIQNEKLREMTSMIVRETRMSIGRRRKKETEEIGIGTETGIGIETAGIEIEIEIETEIGIETGTGIGTEITGIETGKETGTGKETDVDMMIVGTVETETGSEIEIVETRTVIERRQETETPTRQRNGNLSVPMTETLLKAYIILKS